MENKNKAGNPVNEQGGGAAEQGSGESNLSAAKSHLRVALLQAHPSDDQIIIKHVWDALALLEEWEVKSIARAHLFKNLYDACQLALDAFTKNHCIDWSILERALAEARGEEVPAA